MKLLTWTRGGNLLCLAIAASVVIAGEEPVSRQSTLTSPQVMIPVWYTCPPAKITFATNIDGADVVALGKRVAGVPATKTSRGTTEYEIVSAFQPPRRSKGAPDDRGPVSRLEPPGNGTKVTVIGDRKENTGALSLLYGALNDGKPEWHAVDKSSPAAWEYIHNLPDHDQPATIRLRYVVRFVEHDDPLISEDVYLELEEAAFADLRAIASDLPREILRKPLTEVVFPRRMEVYGRLLGLCGNEADAQLLERTMLDSAKDPRIGIEGVIVGYLLLTGEKGLTLVDEQKLRDQRTTFHELYASIQAIRFLWKNDQLIPSERLRHSMRILLDRPELTDLVVADLSRMKDWSVQDRVVTLYDTAPENAPAVKRAIIRYLMVSAKDGAQKLDPATHQWVDVPQVDLPNHVVKATRILIDLEQCDPETTKQVKRFYNPQVPAERVWSLNGGAATAGKKGYPHG